MLLQNSLNEESYLSYVLFSMEQTEKEMATLLKAWKCGNVKFMEEFLFHDPMSIIGQDPHIFKKVYYGRNRNMTDKTISYINDPYDYFIIVGARHLTGDRSILSYLAPAWVCNGAIMIHMLSQNDVDCILSSTVEAPRFSFIFHE